MKSRRLRKVDGKLIYRPEIEPKLDFTKSIKQLSEEAVQKARENERSN